MSADPVPFMSLEELAAVRIEDPIKVRQIAEIATKRYECVGNLYCDRCCDDDKHHRDGVCANCRGKEHEIPCKAHIEEGERIARKFGGGNPQIAAFESRQRHIRREKAATNDTFQLTETGDAEFFAAMYGGEVIYDHRLTRWLLFGPHHWLPQTNGEIDRLVIKAVRARQFAAVGTDKKRANWAIGGESRKRQVNLIQIARSQPPLADAGDGWDADPWLLGVRNGVLNLRTGELTPGSPEDRITKIAPVRYDAAAKAPRWERFVGEVFRSHPELAGYIQRCLGYTLTGITSEQVFWILWGAGANGKSTLIETFTQNVLGMNDYSWTMPFPTAGWTNSMSEYQKARLDGRRLVMASEIERRGHLHEGLVKNLTGSDTVNGRNPCGIPFQFTPVAKFWLRVNDKPIIRDQSHAMWRRVKLIHFTETFTPNDELPRALAAEAAGILAWAVRGCQEWQRQGLDEPVVVTAATELYRQESDALSEFYGDECVIGPDEKVMSGDLFAQYISWCEERRMAGDERLGLKAFGLKVKERFETRRTKAGVQVMGISLVRPGEV